MFNRLFWAGAIPAHFFVMETLLVGLFIGIVSYFINSGERVRAKQDALDLQHDAQDFNSEQAGIERDWQENFFLKYQSPEALFNQYRKLGASDSASLMSSLGVSPSVASGASASSSTAGGLGAGVNSISDLFQSVTGGLNSFMDSQLKKSQTEGQNIQNIWQPRLNQASIDATLGQLELNWKRFGLDKDIYHNISLPLANASIDKTYSDIEVNQMEVKKGFEEILQIQQNIKNLRSQLRLTDAQTDLVNEQVLNTAADTSLKFAQTGLVNQQSKLTEQQIIGQDYANQLNKITLNMSQNLGMDIRLDYKTLTLYAAGKLVGENLQEISNAIDKTYDFLKSSLHFKEIGRKAYDYVDNYIHSPEFFGKTGKSFNFSDSYNHWIKKRGKRMQTLHEWIEHNTRYGM